MKIKEVTKATKTPTITFKTKPTEANLTLTEWWPIKDEAQASAAMLTTAAYLKENQTERYRMAAIYARLYGNHSLFSFIGQNNSKIEQTTGMPTERPTFNLIQSVTDTLVSRISQSQPQPVFLTDNGDYKQRNLAKKLNNFILGEFYNTKAYELATTALRDALVEGTGVVKIFETPDARVGMERILLTELLVDQVEARDGDPRQIYQLKLVDRRVLLANFPEHKKKIEMASKGTPDNSANSSKSVADLVMCVEGWHLRSGKNVKDGRHMLSISTGALIDEEWDKDRFPFVFLHYSPRLAGFWAQGVAEQLMGTQMELNSILYTISQAIKLVGVPRVFQEESSKVMTAAHNNQIGVIVKYRGVKPEYEVAPSNAPELYAERDKLIAYGYQQSGVSALQASSQKPQGLDSGEAIRTYDDISTDRFASLSRRYDNFFIDLAFYAFVAHAGCANDGDPDCPPMAERVAVPNNRSDSLTSTTILSAHRACVADSDCSVIYTACCPSDARTDTDAVNTRYAMLYKYVCTRAEIQRCAENGASIQTSVPRAVCRAQQCGVDYVPINH